jgi:hypothetical protein
LITTGNRNTIIGGYTGNQGGLDIRTASNYIVLSDGDGNPVIASPSQTEVLMRSGSGLWTLFSNGGGNNSTYNGTLIGANKPNLTGQANASLPSWFIDIGGRAADGSTRPVATADKFSVGRQAAGGTLVGAANVFEVNLNGCVGLNATSASNGTGITFPATQNASSNANTLDDYEEGIFSPTIQIGGATPTGVSYFNAVGQYTKVGRVVTCVWGIGANWSSNNGGAVTLHGLPFGNSASGGYREAGMTIGSTSWGGNILRIAVSGVEGATSMQVYKGGGGTTLNGSDLGTEFWMHGTLVYLANA